MQKLRLLPYIKSGFLCFFNVNFFFLYLFIVSSLSFLSDSKTVISLIYFFVLQFQFAFSTHYLMANIQIFWCSSFSSKSFFCKTSLPLKNLYLLSFPDHNVEIFAVYMSKLYWALFCSIFLLNALNASHQYSFHNKFFLNRMNYMTVNFYLSLKMKRVL